MTLDTKVAITGPVSARAVYDFLRPLVGTPDHVQPELKDESIWNPPGIGADAWLIVYHGPNDGVELMPPDDSDDEEDRDYYANNPRHNGTSHVVVSLDTAYGYRTDDGEGCSDLHARLVRALGHWLDAQGIPWQWQNEFTGEWSDRFDNLDAFGNAFRSTGAQDWFTNTVRPAIERLGGRPTV
jgi:hypothetical protein